MSKKVLNQRIFKCTLSEIKTTLQVHENESLKAIYFSATKGD
jgi:hypothetical protein